MRTKSISLAAMVLVGSVAIHAQTADFSGTWVLDAAKSEFPQQAAGRGMPAVREMTVVIKQTADTLHVEQQFDGSSRTLTYRLDGTESTNPGMRGTDVRSTSRWEGKTIVTDGAQTMTGPNGEITIKSHEVRSLASDGTMAVEMTRETPRGKVRSKLVFRRAS